MLAAARILLSSVLAAALASAVAAAANAAPPPLPPSPATLPPACDLTGRWCCDETAVTQTPDGRVSSRAAYGDGNGTLSGRNLTLSFSGASTLWATVSADCATCAWNSGAVWRREQAPAVPAPAWASNLSILEVNALAYTSPAGTGPDGSGSGTWAALTERVAYWRALGISGIWLAYFNIGTYFWHGIKTVYAATDPPTLDPRLGTAAEFRAFVAECHGAGIKVFLDVVGVGVVPNSSYVALDPEFFTFPVPAPPYGLGNYNYTSSAFLTWWEGLWTDYVLDMGVDGMRIDSSDLFPLHRSSTILRSRQALRATRLLSGARTRASILESTTSWLRMPTRAPRQR